MLMPDARAMFMDRKKRKSVAENWGPVFDLGA